jgi:hypothetical protein
MMSDMKLIALIHDGDCSDCSCTHLAIPSTMDIYTEKEDYKRRRHEGLHMSFEDFLIGRGAKHPSSAEIIEVEAY